MSVTVPGGRGLMFISTVAGQFLALLRNVMVARLLGPHEFGIAAIIILTISFLDSLGNVGPQTLLIQAKDENRGPLLAAAHSVTVGRGLAMAVLLLAVASPLSGVFGLQLSWSAIIGLSIPAAMSAFMHQGTRMVQRDGNFRPEAISQLMGELGAFVIAIGAAFITHSHMAIVYSLIGRSIILVAASHWLIPLRYELNRDKSYLARFWTFGWPHLVNGPLLFFAAQADRLFISRELGLAVLGAYSAAAVLIVSPSNAILRWMSINFTPSIARFYHANGGIPTVGVVYNFACMLSLTSFLMFIGFATFGTDIIHIVFGPRYEVSLFVVALIGLLQMLRQLRAWWSVMSMSIAASRGVLASTVVRFFLLPTGIVGLMIIGGLKGLLIGFVIGEALALIGAQLILNRNARRPLAAGMLMTVTFCGLATAVIAALRIMGDAFLPRLGLFAIGSVLGCSLLVLAISRDETGKRVQALRAVLVG